MMDREVALEALGVLCNAKVTSVQRHGFGLQAADISGGSAPSLLTVNDLVHRVLDGDAFRPVPRVGSAGITSPQELVKPVSDENSRGNVRLLFGLPVSFLSIDTDEDSRGAGITSPQESVKPVSDENSRGNFKLVVDEDEFFDPIFDYDFTNITDQQTFYRGEEMYERPCGWKRFALKVLDKYDDDTWLGNNMRTTQSVAGEWPVSYHGTSREGAGGIIPGHYEPGDGQVYGRGIYSTPYISETKPYITEFQSKNTGKWYEALLQNRINPKYREKHNHDKYWLVKIPEGTSEEEEKEMVDRAIRPYGLLVKEI